VGNSFDLVGGMYSVSQDPAATPDGSIPAVGPNDVSGMREGGGQVRFAFGRFPIRVQVA